MKLHGTITALVTPFAKDGSVDYGRLREIVGAQVAGGVEGICAVGTSGESPTLTHEEHHAVIEKTIEFAAGRALVVAGTGANSTAEAVSLTKAAIAMGGAGACLQVTPYYNKPNAEGLYRHFMTVADLGLPVILYYVPGRTWREIPLDVIKVDQTFVTDLATDQYAQSCVKMIGELAEALGVRVCVEGIETIEQFKALENMNVRMVQGFYFDKPMPRADFEAKYLG